MKIFVALAVLAFSLALTACQTGSEYDGVSRFADTGYWDRYYGPGSPPKDT